MNVLKTGILLSVLTVLLVFVGRLIGGPSGAAMAFAFALLVNLGAYWFSGKLVLAMTGLWWPAADPISVIYRGYLAKVGLPLFIGLVIGGLIDHFVPREYVVKLLAGSRKRVIARATLLGFLA